MLAVAVHQVIVMDHSHCGSFQRFHKEKFSNELHTSGYATRST